MKLSRETLLDLPHFWMMMKMKKNYKQVGIWVFLFQKYGKSLKHFYRHLYQALNYSIGVFMSFCYSIRIGIYLGLPIQNATTENLKMMDVLIKTINQNRTNEPVPGHGIPKISGKYVRITSEIELTYTTKHSSDNCLLCQIYFSRQITTFRKVHVAFIFGLQSL